MNIEEVKDLMAKFDGSSLREFKWDNGQDKLEFSKNDHAMIAAPLDSAHLAPRLVEEAPVTSLVAQKEHPTSLVPVEKEEATASSQAEGEAVKSQLVGVVYLKAAPDKPDFVKVGDTVKKGQTLLIIEAMKVMNEIPAPKDGLVTEIMVQAEEVVEFGQELIRIK